MHGFSVVAQLRDAKEEVVEALVQDEEILDEIISDYRWSNSTPGGSGFKAGEATNMEGDR